MKKLSEIEITEELQEKASKCATAEELAALAQEYDVELTQEEITETLKYNSSKELSNDNLDQITGGETHAERTAKYLPADHGEFIDIYEADNYIGHKVYVVDDNDREHFYWGTLVKSYEDRIGIFTTQRMHTIVIDGQNDYWRCGIGTGHIEGFRAKYWSLYLMH